jgi:hypothetical protein
MRNRRPSQNQSIRVVVLRYAQLSVIGEELAKRHVSSFRSGVTIRAIIYDRLYHLQKAGHMTYLSVYTYTRSCEPLVPAIDVTGGCRRWKEASERASTWIRAIVDCWLQPTLW